MQIARKNFYRIFANAENHYIYALNDDTALRLIRRRLLLRFGKCEITDIHLKNYKNEQWDRIKLKRKF